MPRGSLEHGTLWREPAILRAAGWPCAQAPLWLATRLNGAWLLLSGHPVYRRATRGFHRVPRISQRRNSPLYG
jgi:hypothetical protein